MAVTVGVPEKNATLQSIFLVSGVNTISTAISRLELPDGSAAITLTENPNPYFVHQDRRAAIIKYIAGTGISPDEERSYIEKLISENELSRNIKAGVYLIVDSQISLPKDNHGAHRDFKDFSCRLCGGSPPSKSNHYEIAHSFLVSMQMALSVQFDTRLEELDSSVFYQQEDNSYCYCLHLGFGNLGVCFAQPLNEVIFDNMQRYNSAILAESKYRNIATLLVQSRLHGSGQIQTFVLVWAALELLIKSSAPRRIRNLNDKFCFVANLVGAGDHDIQTFSKMNKARNNLFHEGLRSHDLPTDELYRFSIRYLRLLVEYSRA